MVGCPLNRRQKARPFFEGHYRVPSLCPKRSSLALRPGPPPKPTIWERVRPQGFPISSRPRRGAIPQTAPGPKLCPNIALINPTQHHTVRFRGMETGISEASKRVSIFSFATLGGKQASFHFREWNWVQAREAQIRFPAG